MRKKYPRYSDSVKLKKKTLM